MLAIRILEDARGIERTLFISSIKLDGAQITVRTSTKPTPYLAGRYASESRAKEVYEEIWTAIENRQAVYVMPIK